MRGSKSRLAAGSSNLHSWAYSEASETLEVTFLNGSIYEYYHVHGYVNDSLNATQDRVEKGDSQASLGSEFNRLVKNGGYKYRRIA